VGECQLGGVVGPPLRWSRAAHLGGPCREPFDTPRAQARHGSFRIIIGPQWLQRRFASPGLFDQMAHRPTQIISEEHDALGAPGFFLSPNQIMRASRAKMAAQKARWAKVKKAGK
jgi:hypothetical protein